MLRFLLFSPPLNLEFCEIRIPKFNNFFVIEIHTYIIGLEWTLLTFYSCTVANITYKQKIKNNKIIIIESFERITTQTARYISSGACFVLFVCLYYNAHGISRTEVNSLWCQNVCDFETKNQLYSYIGISPFTVSGWTMLPQARKLN